MVEIRDEVAWGVLGGIACPEHNGLILIFVTQVEESRCQRLPLCSSALYFPYRILVHSLTSRKVLNSQQDPSFYFQGRHSSGITSGVAPGLLSLNLRFSLRITKRSQNCAGLSLWKTTMLWNLQIVFSQHGSVSAWHKSSLWTPAYPFLAISPRSYGFPAFPQHCPVQSRCLS